MRFLSPFRLPGLAFALLACGVGSGAAPSDEGRPLSTVYLPEDYQGFEQVWSFAQTTDGLIYATNYGALREFDGRAWRTIPLPTSWVFRVAAAPDDRLFIAGFDEIGVVERTADGGRTYRSLVAHLPAEDRPLGQAQHCVWYRGAAWWSTADRVLRWDGREMRVWRFEAPHRIKMQCSGRHLYVDEGAVALHRFDPEADDFVVFSRDPALCTLAQGVFDSWGSHGSVMVRGNGSVVAFDEAGRATRLEVASERPELARRVLASVLLRDGRLAVGSVGYGLFLLRPDGALDLRFGTEGGLASPDIHGLFEDREGGLWIGTALGLARLEPDRGVSVFDRDNGAPPGVAYTVLRHRGELYCRGDDGLYRLAPARDGLSARFTRIDGPVFNANAFVVHGDGMLLATDEGLLGFDGAGISTGLKTPGALHALLAPRSTPDVVLLSDSNRIRVAGREAAGWRDLGPIPAAECDARSLVEDADGSVWIGTSTRGILRLRRAADSSGWLDARIDVFGTERGLPAGHEWTTVRATPHGIVFVHARGVSVLDAATDRLVSAGAFDAVGRNGRYIYAFTCGADGTMWVQIGDPTRGERAEIGGVAPQPGGGWRWIPLPGRILDALGYLGAQELNWEPGTGGRGVLWAAGQKNLVRVELDAVLRAREPVVVSTLLRDVTLGHAMRLPLRADVGDSTGVVLDHSRDALRFRFTAPTFAAGGLVEFQSRLVGFDDSWSPWSSRDETTFTNLSGRGFAFEVRARVDSGEPGPVTRWTFAVLPPWWLTTYAFVAYALAMALGVVLIVRWRLGVARRERKRLERIVAERTVELAHERDRAAEASQAKTMFLARMSHELRTPLHAILGYSRLLADDPGVPGAARDRLRIVRASGQHLLRLINEVLDLSKIEAGKLELRVEAFDLEVLLQEVCDAQEARATLKSLGFLRPTALPARHVLGDAAKLRQVLENLLGNATKFTAAGEVGLAVAPGAAEGRMRFAVRDTGPGLEPAELEKLFQPFTQTRTGERTREAGTGLGLAISQRLVALMGGRIEVESAPGRGATFSFDIPLPVAASPHPVRREAAIEGYDGPRRHVLAVDDIEANRALFVDLLTPLGFTVATAVTAEEALDRLETRRPDLLLLDLRLPGMNGFELARRIRRDPRHEGMKILAASASVLGHDPGEALAAGCDGFIPKPFLEADFLARVGELLGLTWRVRTPVAVADDRPLDPALLGELDTAARAGDVVGMRGALARLRERHPGSTHVAALEAALADFDIDRLSRLLAAAAAARGATP